MERNSDNLCVSPASASWALSMAAGGARSATATQLYKALGFDTPERETVNLYQQKYIARLASLNDKKTTAIFPRNFGLGCAIR